VLLNQHIDDVLDLLGTPLHVHYTPSCAFIGYDRIFMYPGVHFHTYPVGDDDFVRIIDFRDDSRTTTRGVRLGAAWSAVVAAYGDDYVASYDMRTFIHGDTSLVLFVENDEVVAMRYELIH